MAARAKIERLPEVIKAQLFEKVLTNAEPYSDIAQWLLDEHAIEISTSAVWNFGKAAHDKFGALVDLGMPITEIVKNRLQIEAIGIDQVKQTLIDKLTENPGAIFAYLDKPEGEQ